MKNAKKESLLYCYPLLPDEAVFHIILFIVSARALGFEPRSKVLETRMLPLHHARKKAKSY
jgi:hypothetical protein